MLPGAQPPVIDTPVEPHSRIGRFEVLMRLGAGGMATVFLARNVAEGGFERLVALKVLHPHLLAEEEFLSMFLDEARVAARIHHPNVVAIQDLGVDGSRMFTVMDYVQGDTLAAAQQTAISLRRGLPVPVVLRVALDALQGLDAAHDLVDVNGKSLHVVHRDVTPHNVLMGTDGVARLTDFGIAKAESRLSYTEVGTLKGKSAYMAPEQFSGKRVDRRADIFSMAITVWEAIALRRCLPPDLHNNARRPPYRPLSSILPDVPAELDALLSRALKTDPAARWRSAGEFAEAIERQLRDHIATHRTVGLFVRAFARAKVERERQAIRDVERASTREPRATSRLRGRSGFQAASARPPPPAALEWGPRIQGSLDDDELEPPTIIRPPRESVKPASLVEPTRTRTPVSMPPPPPSALLAPPRRRDAAEPVLKVLRGGTLRGPGDALSTTPPEHEEHDAEHAEVGFVSMPPPSVAPPSTMERTVRLGPADGIRGDTVIDPGGTFPKRPERAAEADTEKPAEISGTRSALRGDTVIDPGARADAPAPLSLLDPEIPKAPKLPQGVTPLAAQPEPQTVELHGVLEDDIAEAVATIEADATIRRPSSAAPAPVSVAPAAPQPVAAPPPAVSSRMAPEFAVAFGVAAALTALALALSARL